MASSFAWCKQRLWSKSLPAAKLFVGTSRTFATNQPTRLLSRAVLRVSGQDAGSYLQGLAANNLLKLKPGAPPHYTAFLTHQGRVICDTFVYQLDEAVYLIDVHTDLRDTLLRHMKKYKIRVKVDIADASSDYIIAQHLGSSEQPFSEHVVALGPDPRHPLLGKRFLLSYQGGDTLPTDATEYIIQRYKLGIPEGPLEIPVGEAFPFECNLDYTHGVALDKGCYLGQELTARTFYRGVTRKRIMPIWLLPLDAPSTDANTLEINRHFTTSEKIDGGKLYVSETGKNVGSLYTHVHNLGLGLVRLEALSSSLALGVEDELNVSSESQHQQQQQRLLYKAIPQTPLWWPT